MSLVWDAPDPADDVSTAVAGRPSDAVITIAAAQWPWPLCNESVTECRATGVLTLLRPGAAPSACEGASLIADAFAVLPGVEKSSGVVFDGLSITTEGLDPEGEGADSVRIRALYGILLRRSQSRFPLHFGRPPCNIARAGPDPL